MDGGDRRRWGGGVGGAAGDDRKVIDRMMIARFRPIAPRPADGDPSGGCVDQLGNKSLLLSKFRTKRKYVRVRSRSKNKSGNRPEEAESSSEKPIVTLQLLPEIADHQRESSKSVGRDDRSVNWLASPPSAVIHSSSPSPSLSSSPDPHPSLMINSMSPQLMDLAARASCIESWVIVESVGTGASHLDALELGLTDDEKAGRLGSSTCPGFVSDLSNRVQWVNRAYETMVRRGFSGGAGDSPTEVAVGLSVKRDDVVGLPRWCGVFTCRVRVQDTWREERRSRVVPCDVWRMDCGGFAWRLDVDAALSLGRPLDIQ